LVGAPNSGKSQLVRTLTHATPEVADYPYTTRIAIPGMMLFENVRLRLLDLPPISTEFTESWGAQLIRNAHAVLWIVDLSDDDVLDRIDETRGFLSNAHTDLEKMKVLMVGNKKDTEGAGEREGIVREIYQDRFPMTTVSAAAASSEEI